MPKVQVHGSLIGYFHPWPLVLVSTVDTRPAAAGKPNIITIGASSICSANPPVVGVAVGVGRYSLELIRETNDFGVNLPDRSQLAATDLCGTVSGRALDKFAAAGFTPQPSTQITAPLIAECPVSLECRVVEVAHLGSHDWVMGEIVAAHVDSEHLRGQALDTATLDPLVCYWGEYWSIGEKLGDWGATRRGTSEKA